MSILIKGMDKPTDCDVCLFDAFGYCSVKGERITSERGIDDDCPLVEIKDMTNEEFDSILARLIADRKTEPQTNCETRYCEDCKHYDDVNGHCFFIGRCTYEPQAEREGE